MCVLSAARGLASPLGPKRTDAHNWRVNTRETSAITGPESLAPLQAERILRSLPEWFGREESLLNYALDAGRLPTFVARREGDAVGFLTVLQHAERAWEVHCMAVHSEVRRQKIGAGLLECLEEWLRVRGARWLQVKTVASSYPSAAYAETRAFYARCGFDPLETFEDLWGPGTSGLQLVKNL